MDKSAGGIVDILLACDRRVGEKTWQVLAERMRTAKVKSTLKKEAMINELLY